MNITYDYECLTTMCPEYHKAKALPIGQHDAKSYHCTGCGGLLVRSAIRGEKALALATETQRQVVKRLKVDILLKDGLGAAHAHNYEYEEFEVSGFLDEDGGLSSGML